jgi:phosphoadenosine phosphosulfate reductase
MSEGPDRSPPRADTARVERLNRRYAHLPAPDMLAAVLTGEGLGRVALVSSFGTEAAVLLALVAEAAPATPVLTVDTGKLFGETKRYRDDLVKRLGLTGLRIVGPARDETQAADTDGLLFRRDPDACCAVRKVRPLERALAEFDGWISGRKRYQASSRSALPLFELSGGKIKINPLANWPRERIAEEFERRGLPRHPLEADGFLSIGCYTCTERVAPGADPRSGRWAGKTKSECGIHTILGGSPAFGAAD